MAIVGQNSLLNQFVPAFFIKDLRDGQTLRYDSVRRAFINAEGSGSGGVDRLGELLDVSDSVDNPLSLQNGQALIYNTLTNLWENKFVDFNTLINVPSLGTGTVTSVTGSGTQGVTFSVVNPTTTPNITIGLGNITPLSVTATGTISGSNFTGSVTGTNTGDQTITLTGDVIGSGTSTFSTTLTNTGVAAGTYGSATLVPVFTVDSKGRITGVTNTPISGGAGGSGTVTSVTVNGTAGRVTSTGSPITTSGTITLDLATTGVTANTYGSATQVPVITVDAFGRITSVTNTTITGGGTVTSVGVSSANSAISVSGSPVTTSGTITVTANTFTTSTPGVVPASGGGTSNFLRADGTWATPAGSGTVTSVSVAGTSGRITSTGSPITSTGTITLDLAASGVTANTYGSATQVPVFTVDSFGRITGVTNTTITSGTGTVTSVAASGGTTGLTFTGSPITTSGTLTLSGTLSIANGGTGATTAQNARNALLPTQTGNAGRFLTTDGTNVSWATISGTGTVTSVAVSGTDGITSTGGPITTSGTITLSLTDTGVTPGTYGSSTQVPVFTVDANGRVSSVTNTTITGGGGSSTPEIVVFRYTAGGVGTLSAVDAIYSQTSGVTATVTDGANSIVSYSFTGKSNPPKSITVYGQIFNTNTFRITAPYTATTTTVLGGGVNTNPDIANGIFTSSNTISIQSRPSDTGAVGAVGQRAWLVVVFGF